MSADSPLDAVSSISEITVSYALMTVGQDANESKIMRLRCADAARELGLNLCASEIERSLSNNATTLLEAVADYSVKAS